MSEKHSMHNDRAKAATLEERKEAQRLAQKRRSALVHDAHGVSALPLTASDDQDGTPPAKRSKTLATLTAEVTAAEAAAAGVEAAASNTQAGSAPSEQSNSASAAAATAAAERAEATVLSIETASGSSPAASVSGQQTNSAAAVRSTETEAVSEAAASDVPAATAAKKTFAERMMEGMGHTWGKGLGREGAGITQPVAVAQRPERAGLGVLHVEAADVGQAAAAPRDWPLFLYDDEPDGPLSLRPAWGAAPIDEAAVATWRLVAGAPYRAVSSTRFIRTSILHPLQDARLDALPAVVAALPTAPWLAQQLPWLALPASPAGSGFTQPRLALLARLVVAAAPDLVESIHTAVALGGADAAAMAEGILPLLAAAGEPGGETARTSASAAAAVAAPDVGDTPAGAALLSAAAAAGVVASIEGNVSDGSTADAALPATAAAWRARLPAWATAPGADLVLLTAEPMYEAAVSGPGRGAAEAEGAARLLRRLLAALVASRAGGALVARLGDVFSRLSASVVYVLHRAFARCRLYKPFLASSLCGERLLVCADRAEDLGGLIVHVERAIAAQDAYVAEGRALLSFVPMALLLDPGFLTHVVNANERLAVREAATTRYCRRLLQVGVAGASGGEDTAVAEAESVLPETRAAFERLVQPAGGKPANETAIDTANDSAAAAEHHGHGE